MSAPGVRHGDPPSTSEIVTSPGIAIAPFAGGAIAYDALGGAVHVLDPVAAWVVASAGHDGVATEALVAEATGATGADRRVVAADLADAVGRLRDLGVLDRSEPYDPPGPWTGSDRTPPAGWTTGAVHAVLDHGIAFRGPDPTLLEAVDGFFGTALDRREVTVYVDVEPDGDGGVLLTAADEWRFPTRSGFFAQLPGVVNEYAARSLGHAALHAGAVRTPDGRIVLLPGEVDAGKSTVIGALIQAGCDYLGDESIGLRPDTSPPAAIGYPKPLTLDATSREVLGLAASTDPHLAVEALRADVVRLAGDHGPIDHVLLPRYRGPHPTDPQRHADPSTTVLEPGEALRALLGHCLNLARSGSAGLASIAALAETVPVTRVVHLGSADLARAVVRGDVASVSGPPAAY